MHVYYSPSQEKFMIESGKPAFFGLLPKTNKRLGKFLAKHPEHTPLALIQAIALFHRIKGTLSERVRDGLEKQVQHIAGLCAGNKETK